MNADPLLPAALFLVAALYAAVGHGGASGYLAVMALAGFTPAVMRPTALTLNLAVSLIGTLFFVRRGWFRSRLFWPFAFASVPFAYLGGRAHLSGPIFNFLLAGALVCAASRLLMPARSEAQIRAIPVWAVAVTGAAIGLVSGAIGVGGGIFLTPLLILCRWSDAKTAAAVSAPFIFVNSCAGLLGAKTTFANLPAAWPWMVVAVMAGGALGANWGSGPARSRGLRTALAAVLGAAVVKLVVN